MEPRLVDLSALQRRALPRTRLWSGRHRTFGWLVGDHFGIVHAVATIGAAVADVTTAAVLPLSDSRALVREREFRHSPTPAECSGVRSRSRSRPRGSPALACSMQRAPLVQYSLTALQHCPRHTTLRAGSRCRRPPGGSCPRSSARCTRPACTRSRRSATASASSSSTRSASRCISSSAARRCPRGAHDVAAGRRHDTWRTPSHGLVSYI